MPRRAGGGDKEAAVTEATRDGQAIGRLEHVRQIPVEEAVPLRVKVQALGAGPGRAGGSGSRQVKPIGRTGGRAGAQRVTGGGASVR